MVLVKHGFFYFDENIIMK